MIKFQSKKTFLFLSTQVLFFVYQQIFPQELKLTAENVIFDKNNNIVIAEENVKLQYKNIFLETQKLFYDTQKNIVYISTDVFLSYLGNKLFAKSLQYDVNSEKITIQNFYSFYEPYYSYSKFCSVEKEKLLLEEAKVTH
jgi:lipopolysaccharide assembly outer membrane protein LptD (OstA)